MLGTCSHIFPRIFSKQGGGGGGGGGEAKIPVRAGTFLHFLNQHFYSILCYVFQGAFRDIALTFPVKISTKEKG